MYLNIISPISHLGYGIHSNNMIKAFIESGVGVHLDPIGPIQEDDWFKPFYIKALSTPKQNGPTLDIFHTEHLNISKHTRPLINFCVFETTKISERSRKILNQIDKVFVTTGLHKKILLDNGVETPIFVVHEGIDPILFNTNKIQPLIDTGKFTYLMVGKAEKRKCTNLVIKSFIETLQYEEVALICHTFNPFIGKYFENDGFYITNYGYKPIEINNLYEKFSTGLSDIYLTKPINSTKDIPKLYHSANIGIACSRAEGWDLPCFSPGTRIQTSLGYKNIEDIKVGEKVLTHLGREKTVINTFINKNIKGKIYKIYVYGNNLPIIATEEHPILGVKNNKDITSIIKSDINFIKVKDLQINDYLIKSNINLQKVNKDTECFDLLKLDDSLCFNNKFIWYKTGYNKYGKLNKIKRYINIKDCLFLLGLYLAEGCFTGEKINISLHSKETEYANRFIKDIKMVFGYKKSWIRKVKNHLCIHVECGSKIIGKFFDYFCGHGAHNKKLAENLYLSEYNREILENAFLGDGHVDKLTNWKSYTTVSLDLAEQFFSILQNDGEIPTISKRIRPDKRIIYVISWLEDSDRRHSRKMTYLYDIGTVTRIKNIEIEEYDGMVHNLEVEQDNTYQLESITAHNCCETLGCGIPCITTNVMGHSEYLPHDLLKGLVIDSVGSEPANDGIWFNGQQGDWAVIDPEDIRNKIEYTYNNKEKYLIKNKDISNYMKNNFSWSAATKQAIEHLY